MATIKFSQINDGHLHRFEYKAKDGTSMRFIIIKKNGGAYGVGLDACDNCGDAGYYEKDGKIICKKCDVAINLATIGFKGGCNPIPFDYQVKPAKSSSKRRRSTHCRRISSERKEVVMFFFRMIFRSFSRQFKRRLLIAVTVCLSATVSVAMLGVVFDVGDKLNAELSTYGSNIVVQPKSDAVVSDLYNTGILVDANSNASGSTSGIRSDRVSEGIGRTEDQNHLLGVQHHEFCPRT